MRHLVIALAATSLALGGCGKKAVTGNTSAVDETVSAQDFTTNDTTAIDAATGADANMAADVDINLPENLGNDSSDSGKPAPKRPTARSNSGSSTPSPTSNSTAATPAQTPPAATATPPAEGNSN